MLTYREITSFAIQFFKYPSRSPDASSYDCKVPLPSTNQSHALTALSSFIHKTELLFIYLYFFLPVHSNPLGLLTHSFSFPPTFHEPLNGFYTQLHLFDSLIDTDP
jgi:hypothetical protein